jgi:voltage-gated potassium channel
LQGIYWALTTMTTVGYGDEAPTTTTGKFAAAAVMLVGIGFIAVVTGALANAFISRAGGPEEATKNRLDNVIERLARLEALMQEQTRRDDR